MRQTKGRLETTWTSQKEGFLFNKVAFPHLFYFLNMGGSAGSGYASKLKFMAASKKTPPLGYSSLTQIEYFSKQRSHPAAKGYLL